MSIPRLAALASLSVMVSTAALPSPASANVDLEFRTRVPFVRVGGTVEVGLYAVSDDGTDQPLAGVDAILSWDPAVLKLIGRINNGPYDWLVSLFPDDSRIDGLNADCSAEVFCTSYTGIPYNDGDALYQVVGRPALDPPPLATPKGLLVATIVFLVTADAPTTTLGLLEEAGAASATIVADAVFLGADITGELRPMELTISPCATLGDFDGDCRVSLLDYERFVPCVTGPAESTSPGDCEVADLDGDVDADLSDVAVLQLIFSGS